MTTIAKASLVVCSAAAQCLAFSQAAAQEKSSPPTENDQWLTETANRPPKLADQRLRHEWDGGALDLRMTRVKEGRRHAIVPDSASYGPWHRDYRAEATLSFELAPGTAARLQGGVDYSQNGAAGGPLLTHRTTSLSGEASIALLSDRGTGLALYGFEAGGWTQGPLADVANRLANGEDLARSGVAIELRLAEFAPGDTGAARVRVRAESARSDQPGADDRVMLTMERRF